MKLLKYRLMTEVDCGTKDEPNIVQTFADCEIQCADETFDSNLAIAQAEAFNGEVTVEEVEGDCEPTLNELMNALLGSDW